MAIVGGARSRVTGYLDRPPHFPLECTISGKEAKVRPDFRQCWSGLERWITYLKKSKSVATDVIWKEAQQNREKKCETWWKRDAHWGNPLPVEKPTSMKRAVLLNCLLDKAGLRVGKPLRATTGDTRQWKQRGLHWYSAELSKYSPASVVDLNIRKTSVLQEETSGNGHIALYIYCIHLAPILKLIWT